LPAAARYDTLNRLTTLTPPSAFTSGSFGFGYDALSRRTSLTRGGWRRGVGPRRLQVPEPFYPERRPTVVRKGPGLESASRTRGRDEAFRLLGTDFSPKVGRMTYSDIITIEPGKRGGKPCIRGLRVTVYDVLEYLASGMTHADVLREFPFLTEEDIRACLAYAADRERKLEISNA